jgi:hypothetical protein
LYTFVTTCKYVNQVDIYTKLKQGLTIQQGKTPQIVGRFFLLAMQKQNAVSLFVHLLVLPCTGSL